MIVLAGFAIDGYPGFQLMLLDRMLQTLGRCLHPPKRRGQPWFREPQVNVILDPSGRLALVAQTPSVKRGLHVYSLTTPNSIKDVTSEYFQPGDDVKPPLEMLRLARTCSDNYIWTARTDRTGDFFTEDLYHPDPDRAIHASFQRYMLPWCRNTRHEWNDPSGLGFALVPSDIRGLKSKIRMQVHLCGEYNDDFLPRHSPRRLQRYTVFNIEANFSLYQITDEKEEAARMTADVCGRLVLVATCSYIRIFEMRKHT